MNYDFVLNALNTTRLIVYNNSEIPLVHVRNNIEGFFDEETSTISYVVYDIKSKK